MSSTVFYRNPLLVCFLLFCHQPTHLFSSPPPSHFPPPPSDEGGCAHASVILSLPAAAFSLLVRVRPGPHSFENQMALYICSPNYWTVIWTWVMGEMDRRLTLIDLHKEPVCRQERQGGIYFKRISLGLSLSLSPSSLAMETRVRPAPPDFPFPLPIHPTRLSSCGVPLEPHVLSCSS